MSLNAVQESSLPAEVVSDADSLADLACVEEALRQGVKSSEAIPLELSRRLVLSGGKRIRPYLMCLSYRCLINNHCDLKPRATVEDLHALATVAEWVHTATLFHDDVLDASPERRHQSTAHVTHGNKTAILVGDFVYAEAFSMLMERGLMEPSRGLASTVKTVVEGELVQHQVAQNRSLSFKEFEKIARAKTASLFAWCTSTGAWVAGSPHVEVARNFGMSLGYAFQMADDLLDTFSLDVEKASEADLIQWSDSAPSLPMVLLQEFEGKAQATWKRLATELDVTERRALTADFQRQCEDERVLTECLNRVNSALSASQAGLKVLGATQGLGWAIEAIGERATRGVKLAGKK